MTGDRGTLKCLSSIARPGVSLKDSGIRVGVRAVSFIILGGGTSRAAVQEKGEARKFFDSFDLFIFFFIISKRLIDD